MTKDFSPTDWITTKEAAELTGYDAVHIRRLVREERVEGRRFGRAWTVNRDSLQEYAGQMKRLGPARHDPRGMAVRLNEETG